MLKLKGKNLYLLLLIILFGSLLRIFLLDNQSIWFDEARSILVVGRNPFLAWSNQISYSKPPLYFTILHYWMNIFGNNVFVTRLFSALFGILSIFLIFLFGYRFFSLRVGFFSSLLLTISPFHIYYSQEARMYTLLVFLIMLSSYLFLVSLNEKKIIYWIGYIISITSAFYVHNYGFFPFLAHTVYYLLFYRKVIRQFVLSAITIIILWSYRLNLFTQQINLNMNPWITEPNLKSLLRSFQHYILLSWHMPETLVVKISLYLLIPIFGFLIIKFIFNKFDIENVGKFKSFLLLNLIFSTLVPFVFSVYIVPIYVPGRYEIIGLPFFIIIISLGIIAIKNYWIRNLLVISIVSLTLITLPTYYFFYQKNNSSYIAEFIKSQTKKEDILLFTNQSLLAIYYYLPNAKCEKCFSYPEDTLGGYISKAGLEGEINYVNSQINMIMSKIYKIMQENSNIFLFYNDDPFILNNALLSKFRQHFTFKEKITFPRNQYTHFQVNECYIYSVSFCPN